MPRSLYLGPSSVQADATGARSEPAGRALQFLHSSPTKRLKSIVTYSIASQLEETLSQHLDAVEMQQALLHRWQQQRGRGFLGIL